MARPKNLDFESEWGKAAQREGSGRWGGEAEQPRLRLSLCARLCNLLSTHTHTQRRKLLLAAPGISPRDFPAPVPALRQLPRRASPARRESCAPLARLLRSGAAARRAAERLQSLPTNGAPAVPPPGPRRAAAAAAGRRRVPRVPRAPAEFCGAANFLPSNE